MRQQVSPQHQQQPKVTPLPGGRVLQRQCACGQHTSAGDECTECKKKRLQRRATNQAEPATAPPIVHEVLRSPGHPLDPVTRAYMEPRFGHDFSRVRVHTGARAEESAQAVQALAYTVGQDIVFGDRQYTPQSSGGRRLIAHELAHVVQQGGSLGVVQTAPIVPDNHESEREADGAARAVAAGHHFRVRPAAIRGALSRARGDLVKYSGGVSGTLTVIQGGTTLFSTNAISGHPGSKEYEKNVGPIPTGTYVMHPTRTRAKVTRLQSGVCGANAIPSGFQEITSNDPSPCADPPSHYCTVGCATSGNPGRMCFTPRECWGEKRIKIEGSARVRKPTGGIVTRSGFYIHGGNHVVTVTSGCIKVFDNTAFDHIRKLKGRVPLCVGSACPAPAAGSGT